MIVYRIVRGLLRIYLKLFNNWVIEGHTNIPAIGPVVLAANHISLWDPIYVGCSTKRVVHYMAKEELFKPLGLKQLITALGAFPIKRKSRPNALRLAAKYLEDGEVLGLFPEGTEARPRNPDLSYRVPRCLPCGLGLPSPIALIGTERIFMGKIVVRIGKPLTYPEYYGGKISEEVLDRVTQDYRQRILEMLAD